MDSFFASPEMQICRMFRDACSGASSTILRRPPGTSLVQEFARSTAAGLLSAPRRLESRFLYDEVGSDLFDLITKQPEYYLTRTEAAILSANASRIRELTGAVTMVELGSGSAAKTDFLLSAWLERAGRSCYVPVDVSESALAGALSRINEKFPQVRVVGVNSEYRDAFPLLAQISPVMVVFLGSSIGNFSTAETSRFLMAIASSLQPSDWFLLGVDLVKEPRVIEAAYNDAEGVTARFTRNIFARMNRELGSSIDTDTIEHVSHYAAEREQIETFARFTKQQAVYLAPLDRHLIIPKGEMVQVEISRKFRLERFIPYLERFGFTPERVFTDERQWFALLLLRRTPRLSLRMTGRS